MTTEDNVLLWFAYYSIVTFDNNGQIQVQEKNLIGYDQSKVNDQATLRNENKYSLGSSYCFQIV